MVGAECAVTEADASQGPGPVEICTPLEFSEDGRGPHEMSEELDQAVERDEKQKK